MYYVGAQNGVLYGINCNNGDIITTVQLSKGNKAALNASPSMDMSGNMVLGCYDGHLYFLPYHWLLNTGRTWQGDSVLPDGLYLHVNDDMTFIKTIELKKYVGGERIPHIAFSGDKVWMPVGVRRKLQTMVSSDGRYIIMVRHDASLKEPLPRSFPIHGKYFPQTGNWLSDRMVFHEEKAFEGYVSLAASDIDMRPGGRLADFTRFVLSSMYCHHPKILDTYIPAALDAQGYLGVLLKSADGIKFPVLCFSVIPDSDGFVINKDMNKTLLMQGTYHQDSHTMTVENTSPFIMSAMGGTIPFAKFKAMLSFNTGKGEFVAEAFCPTIKGNDADYKFSQEIIPMICDYQMRLISIGTVDVEQVAENNRHAINVEKLEHIVESTPQ